MIQTREIPQEQATLYNDYLARVASLKVSTIMWVVMDYGHKIMMVDKDEHKEMVRRLLVSGDSVRERVAVEVMSRTLGIWSRK